MDFKELAQNVLKKADNLYMENDKLATAMQVIENQTDHFNSVTLGFINISRITYEDYEEIVREIGLL